VIADQVAEYSHHGYAVVAIGVQGIPGQGLHWRRLARLLQHRGVAAWLLAWRAVSATPPAPRPTQRDSLPPNGSADGLVQALAGMALGALAGG